MSNQAVQAAFYYMAVASVMCAAMAVTRRNPIHSMLWVLALFLHIAGIFLILGAEFLAAVQVIVYAGAVLVFYLFVMMLLDVPGESAREPFGRHWPLAAITAFALVVVIMLHSSGHAPAMDQSALAAPGAHAPRSIAEVGTALFGPFALPFEMASLVLLAAIVGAVVLARKRP